MLLIVKTGSLLLASGSRAQGSCYAIRQARGSPGQQSTVWSQISTVPRSGSPARTAVRVHALSFHSCPTLCDPMGCSPPGSSVHGFLQARILEWVAIIFSRDLSDPGIEPGSPVLQADSLPSEPSGMPLGQ